MMWKIVIVLVAALALASAQDQAALPQNCSAPGVESIDWNNTAVSVADAGASEMAIAAAVLLCPLLL